MKRKFYLIIAVLLISETLSAQIKSGDIITALHGSGSHGQYESVFIVNGTSKVNANWNIDGKSIVVKRAKQAPIGNGINILGEIDSILLFIHLPDAEINKEVKLPDSYKESFTAFTGTVYKEGDTLQLGMGTMDNGAFKYIQMSQYSVGVLVTATNNVAYNKDQWSLDRRYAGYKAVIRKFERRGTRRIGYKTVAIIKFDSPFSDEVDINSAIKSGEIIDPNYTPNTPHNTQSVADEIKKLKDLEDQGIITKEEFEKQKQKLLK